ncbi:unnamed protein product [Aureobasidium uvarum]|uniref:Uncharacterized protein n=1 Tax=Aureobasidium uvarum TaxID=2773716 RepID=A0A9N8PSZ2_9PEZI|nr:unnamed protein product [Aureobasidium uvarum]
MANLIFPTRYQKTNDGWVREADDQQITSILHKHVLDTKDKFIISSFDANAMELRITVGVKKDICTWEETPDPNAFHFEFVPQCQGRQRTLPTRFHEEQVQVCLDNKWILMVDYLEEESKKDETNPNYVTLLCPENRTKLVLKAQQKWWDANKKSFPLLDLPSELRNEIYRHAAPQDAIEPYARHCMRGRDMPHINDRNNMVSNLLRCNKVVAEEMRAYMFRCLPLLINHERLLSKTLRRNLHFPRKLLTHLTLAFPTHRDIINIFGLNARNINTDEEITIEGKEYTALSLCRDQLPFIKKLEIIIPSREVLDKTYVNHCHTDATTMLLEIMWPYIEGHPVVLGGMVKKWQKKLWRKKFAQAHKEYEESLTDTEDGGVQITQEDRDRFDGKAEHNDYDEDGNCCDCAKSCCLLHYEEPEGEYEYEIPFLCQCDPPCLYSEWTDEDRIRDKDED